MVGQWYKRLLLSLSVGIGVTSGLARGDGDKLPSEEIKQAAVKKAAEDGTGEVTQVGFFRNCGCGAGDCYAHEHRLLNIMNNYHGSRCCLMKWARLGILKGCNCDCTDCGTLGSEACFMFGSCGNFYCGPQRVDLINNCAGNTAGYPGALPKFGTPLASAPIQGGTPAVSGSAVATVPAPIANGSGRSSAMVTTIAPPGTTSPVNPVNPGKSSVATVPPAPTVSGVTVHRITPGTSTGSGEISALPKGTISSPSLRDPSAGPTSARFYYTQTGYTNNR